MIGFFVLPLALIWIAVFWVTCVAIPMSGVLARAGGFSHESLFDPVILSVLRFTVLQASWSTFFSILLGLPLGLWLGPTLSRT